MISNFGYSFFTLISPQFNQIPPKIRKKIWQQQVLDKNGKNNLKNSKIFPLSQDLFSLLYLMIELHYLVIYLC